MEPKTKILDYITDLVCYYSGIYRDAIFRGRKAKFTVPRQIAMYILFNYFNRLGIFWIKGTPVISVTEIGDYYMRDHSTVSAAVKKVNDMILIKDAEYCYLLKCMHDKVRKFVIELEESSELKNKKSELELECEEIFNNYGL